MKSNKIIISILAVIGGIAVCFFGFLYLWAYAFGTAGNDRDSSNPKMQKEMISCTLAWGQLAPFPKTATEFNIRTEGTSFTRTFKGSFSDTEDNIKSWLNASPGVINGNPESESKIILKTGEGAAYGEILISPDKKTVAFSVSWS